MTVNLNIASDDSNILHPESALEENIHSLVVLIAQLFSSKTSPTVTFGLLIGCNISIPQAYTATFYFKHIYKLQGEKRGGGRY